MNTLNAKESALLLAIITSDTSLLTDGKLNGKAKESLIQKGYLRVNKHSILELNLSDTYLKDRGY